MFRLIIWLTATWGVLTLAGGSAFGQYQIRQGQVLDANQMLGSGGLNQPRGALQFDRGNQIITGNVAGGLSFRGYSPIRDPGAFRTMPGAPGTVAGGALTSGGFGSGSYLPSDSLYNFQRDSYGVTDYQAGRKPYGAITPYYSTSSTILNTGSIVSGQSRPGTSQLRSPYQTPSDLLGAQRSNLLSSVQDSAAGGTLLALPSRVVRATTGQAVTGQVDYRLMANPLFAGAFREVSSRDLARVTSQGEALAYGQGSAQPQSAQPIAGPMPPAQVQGPVDLLANRAPLDRRVKSGDLLVGRKDETGDSRIQGVLTRAAEDGDYGTAGGDPGAGLGRTRLLGPRSDERTAADGSKAGVGLTGQADLYSWMRHKSEQLAIAAGAPLPGGAKGTPGGTAPRTTGGGAILAEALTSQEPSGLSLRSFVGTEASSLNAQLRYAEEAMRAGRYYRAAEAYSLARTIAPDNPLPALGQCLALLAAGDYIASSSYLFEAIQLFGSLGDFSLDMKAFIPDIHLLDSRRADLEKRLAVRDNGRLRFLLGFTEYNSQLKKLGVGNMTNGMQLLTGQDVDMTAVRRFVESLAAKVGVSQPVPAPLGN